MVFATLITIVSQPTFIYGADIEVGKIDAMKIARKIWRNEGSSMRSKLVWWNRGEEFASLGIGHFIWYTRERPMWFYETFPDMLRYIMARGAKPPAWLTPRTHCIWRDYGEWREAVKRHDPKLWELIRFLDETKALQAKYMVRRLSMAYDRMIDYAPDEKSRRKIEREFNRLLYRKGGSIDPDGAYPLIDYTNFKGEGTLKSERYKGQGWGLLQVLEHLDENATNKYKAFADSAKAMLSRRIKNSPPARGEERWRRGWNSRLDTYWK